MFITWYAVERDKWLSYTCWEGQISRDVKVPASDQKPVFNTEIFKPDCAEPQECLLVGRFTNTLHVGDEAEAEIAIDPVVVDENVEYVLSSVGVVALPTGVSNNHVWGHNNMQTYRPYETKETHSKIIRPLKTHKTIGTLW